MQESKESQQGKLKQNKLEFRLKPKNSVQLESDAVSFKKNANGGYDMASQKKSTIDRSEDLEESLKSGADSKFDSDLLKIILEQYINSPLLVEQASAKLGRVFQKERDKVSQLKAQLKKSEKKNVELCKELDI